MKTKILACVVVISSLITRQSSHAQGALTPPGAPAPTMKTLDQIQPRIPLALPAIINQSGSYYVTNNYNVPNSGEAIGISTNGVSVDLNGFTLSSTDSGNNSTAITILGSWDDISIFNGHIISGVTNNGGVFSGNGFGYGIFGGSSTNVQVRDVTVSGCRYHGIYMPNGGTVEGCSVTATGNYGIFAWTVRRCTAVNCGSTAIYGFIVTDCQGQSLNGQGISATSAQNSYGDSDAANSQGIVASSAVNCYGTSTAGGSGLVADGAENCYGTSLSGTGIYANSALNCSGYANANGTGISASEVLNCQGINYNGTGYGIYATGVAENSYGDSPAGFGINAFVAQCCYGSCTSGTGLNALIGTSCHGITSSGTALNITHSLNSF